MYYRSNVVFAGTATAPTEWGNSHSVMVYELGAVASASGIVGGGSTVVPVFVGHGFAVGDKVLLWRGGLWVYLGNSGVTVVDGGGMSITLDGEHQIVAGDRLVNLGPDTGATAPAWDGSGLVVMRDPDGSTAFSNARVFTDQRGNYSYYIGNDTPAWELILDAASEPVGLLEGNGIQQP